MKLHEQVMHDATQAIEDYCISCQEKEIRSELERVEISHHDKGLDDERLQQICSEAELDHWHKCDDCLKEQAAMDRFESDRDGY